MAMIVRAKKFGTYKDELRAPARERGYRNAGATFQIEDHEFNHRWMEWVSGTPPPPRPPGLPKDRGDHLPGLKRITAPVKPKHVPGPVPEEGEETAGVDVDTGEASTESTVPKSTIVTSPGASANVPASAKPKAPVKPKAEKAPKGTGSRQVL